MKQVEGSIYLYAAINPSEQDFLIRLQDRMAERVDSLGDISFNDFRAFKTMTRQASKPERFVDGELIERFLTCEAALQKEISDEQGRDVEEVKALVEALRRLH